MRDKGGNFVFAAEWKGADGELRIMHMAYETQKDALASFRGPLAGSKRKWMGDVFFDHVRGVVAEEPKPASSRAPHPFLLVCYWEYFDWNAMGSAKVTECDSAAELIQQAQELVASERAAGGGVSELWEVYGVRVLKYRSSWFGL